MSLKTGDKLHLDTDLDDQSQQMESSACTNAHVSDPTQLICPQPLGTFTPFPRLPAELRLKIWHQAHDSSSRILEIIPRNSEAPSRNHWTSISVTASTIPVLLSVCKESRDELFPLYTTPFNSANVIPLIVDSSTEDLLICWKTDVLFINMWYQERNGVEITFNGRITYGCNSSCDEPQVFLKQVFRAAASIAEICNLAGDSTFWLGGIFRLTVDMKDAKPDALCCADFKHLQKILHVPNADPDPRGLEWTGPRLQHLRFTERPVEAWLDEARTHPRRDHPLRKLNTIFYGY